jgi:glycosyltransferase involved in cell wall biosynthesis
MKVSIQIPTYNQENFIGKTIESALQQDYQNLEVVVLDDCSTDKTYQVAKRYESEKVKVFRNDKNLGRAFNYHKLLYELLSGDFVVNLDGDDYFCDNHFISRAIENIKQNDDVLFYQSCIMSKGEGTEFRFQHKLLGEKIASVFDGKDYFKRFHKNEFFGHLSTVYNAVKAKEIGFYKYNNITADSESLLKLALNGKVYLDNRITGVWNIHDGNESKSMLTKNDAIIDAFARIRDYSIPFIGVQEASLWFSDAMKINRRSFSDLVAKHDFQRFLKESEFSDYLSASFWKLVAKKIIGRI